jgi:hypothetical protein
MQPQHIDMVYASVYIYFSDTCMYVIMMMMIMMMAFAD